MTKGDVLFLLFALIFSAIANILARELIGSRRMTPRVFALSFLAGAILAVAILTVTVGIASINDPVGVWW